MTQLVGIEDVSWILAESGVFTTQDMAIVPKSTAQVVATVLLMPDILQ